MIENKQLTYKETGLDWMPEVPEHWKMVRLKYITKYQKGKVPKVFSDDTSLFPYLAMDYLRGKAEVIQYVEPNEELKLVENDEILVLWDGANAGEILKSKKGYISSTMAAIEPDEKYFIKDFFYYFLKSLEKDLKQLSTGTTIPHLNQDYLFGSHFYTPPKDEQDKIVQYIKAQEEKINLFIQKKQRLIELLKEQRQRLINHSVTKGINSNAEMKDTGIEWLGKIPKHWQLRRLKNVAEVVLGKMLCNEDKGGYALKPYLKSKNIGWDKVIIEEVDEMWFSPKEMLTYRVKENDLLVSEGGEVGKTCIWKNELDECYIQNSVHKLTCFEDCLPEFYLFWMGMLGSVGYLRSIVNQVSIAHLTREKVVTIICLHPPIEEQKQIVSHIKTETATIDTAIAKAEREIELIREYKEAMIAEAVMGKVLNRIK